MGKIFIVVDCYHGNGSTLVPVHMLVPSNIGFSDTVKINTFNHVNYDEQLI